MQTLLSRQRRKSSRGGCIRGLKSIFARPLGGAVKMVSRWVIAFQHASALDNAPARPTVRLCCHSAKVHDDKLDNAPPQVALVHIERVRAENHFTAMGRVRHDVAYERK